MVVDFQHSSENLASAIDAANGSGGTPQSFQQTSHYLDGFPQQHLVIPQEVNMIPRINASTNPYPQEAIIPPYLVPLSRSSSHVSTSSSKGISPFMEADSTVPNRSQAGGVIQRGSALRAPDQSLTVPKPHLVRRPPMSQPKTTIVHNTRISANGPAAITNRSQGPKESDHSSSKMITEKEASDAMAIAASEILRQFKGSKNHSNHEIELVIRTQMLHLFDPTKKGNRSTPASPTRDSPDPERPYKCVYALCHKRKKTQCDLKYISLLN